MSRSRTTSPKARRRRTLPLLSDCGWLGERRMAEPEPTRGVGRRYSTEGQHGPAVGLERGEHARRGPERALSERKSRRPPVLDELRQQRLCEREVGNGVRAVREEESDLGSRQPGREELEQRRGRLGGRREVERGIEIRE